jgi:hypothetical protein
MRSAIERGKQALALHVEGMIEDGKRCPSPARSSVCAARSLTGSATRSSFLLKSKSPQGLARQYFDR